MCEGSEKQLLRAASARSTCGSPHVKGDVAPFRPFVAQRLDQLWLVSNVWAKISRPQPQSTATSGRPFLGPALVPVDARFNGLVAQAQEPVPQRLVGRPRTFLSSPAERLAMPSDPVCLQPHFQEPDLPQFRTLQGGDVVGRVRKRAVEIVPGGRCCALRAACEPSASRTMSR